VVTKEPQYGYIEIENENQILEEQTLEPPSPLEIPAYDANVN
jgi:hypothetical protein